MDYKNKIITVGQALDMVKSGMRIALGDATVEPQAFLENIHTIADRVKDVELTNCLGLRSYPFMENSAYHDSFILRSLFFSKPTREAEKYLRVSYVPCHLRHTARAILAQGKPDLFVTTCTPPDEEGNMSIGLSNIYSADVVKHAKKVIVEINDKMPYTYGNNIINVKDVDYIVPVSYPLPQDVPPAPNEKDRMIAGHIAEYLKDGDCVQIGIGGIPNSVTEFLAEKKDLGIHTELLGDGLAKLAMRGVVNGSKKQFMKGKIVTSIVMGTDVVYDFVNKNPDVYVMSCSKCNDPYTVRKNKNQVSINTTLEVDLTGQACSEAIGSRQFSGTGGQADTTIGTQMSKGGRSFLALYSTARVLNKETGEREEISKIVPQLKPGATVSLQRNDAMYIVTEYGAVNLMGLSVSDRAKKLISIAHPKFREGLTLQAKALGLIKE